MQRIYKIMLRAASLVFLSAIVFSGNLGKLMQKDGEGSKEAQKGSDGIFCAFVPPTALADVPMNGSGGSGCPECCGDSCDGE